MNILFLNHQGASGVIPPIIVIIPKKPIKWDKFRTTIINRNITTSIQGKNLNTVIQ